MQRAYAKKENLLEHVREEIRCVSTHWSSWRKASPPSTASGCAVIVCVHGCFSPSPFPSLLPFSYHVFCGTRDVVEGRVVDKAGLADLRERMREYLPCLEKDAQDNEASAGILPHTPADLAIADQAKQKVFLQRDLSRCVGLRKEGREALTWPGVERLVVLEGGEGLRFAYVIVGTQAGEEAGQQPGRAEQAGQDPHHAEQHAHGRDEQAQTVRLL